MPYKVVRGRLEARDWALSRDLAFSLSALLSPENFGIGSFCVSQQVAVECQVKLRVPLTHTPFSLPTRSSFHLLEEPKTDPSVYGFSIYGRVAVDLSTSISINYRDEECRYILRWCAALLIPVAIWHQGVSLILAGWHCAAVTDKKAAACGDTTGPVSLFLTAALFIALCPVPFDFPSSFWCS